MTSPHVDESHVGIYLWVVLIVVVNATWIGMDLWLHVHGHEFLTTEFKEGLKGGGVWPPLLAFLTFGTIAAFIVHMWGS